MLDDNQRPKRAGVARRTPASVSLTGKAATTAATAQAPSVLVQMNATPRNQISGGSPHDTTALSDLLAAASSAADIVSPKEAHAAAFLQPRGEWRTHAFLTFGEEDEYLAALHQRVVGAAPPQCKWDSFAAVFHEQIAAAADASVEQQQHQQQPTREPEASAFVDDLSVDAVEVDFERVSWVKRLTAATATATGSPTASVLSGGAFVGRVPSGDHRACSPLDMNSPSSAFGAGNASVTAPPALQMTLSVSRPGTGATIRSAMSGAHDASGGSPHAGGAAITAASLASLQQRVQRRLTPLLPRRAASQQSLRGGKSSAGVASLSNSMISNRSHNHMRRGGNANPLSPSGSFSPARPPQLHLTEARILALACDLPPGTRVLPAAFIKAQQEQRHPAFFPNGSGCSSANTSQMHHGGGASAAEAVTATIFIETIMGASTPQSEAGIAACERAFAGPWFALFSRWIPTVFFQLECLERDAAPQLRQQQQQQQQRLDEPEHASPPPPLHDLEEDEDDDGLVSFDVLGMLVARLWVRFTEGPLALHPVLVAQCVRHAMSALPARIDMSTAGQLLLDFVVDVFLEHVSTKELTALLGAVTALANDPLTDCETRHWALSSASTSASAPRDDDAGAVPPAAQRRDQPVQFAWHVDFTANPALAVVLKIPVAAAMNVALNRLARGESGDVGGGLCCEHESVVPQSAGGFVLVAPARQFQHTGGNGGGGGGVLAVRAEDSFCSNASATGAATSGLVRHTVEPLSVQHQQQNASEMQLIADRPGDHGRWDERHNGQDGNGGADDVLSWSAQQYGNGNDQNGDGREEQPAAAPAATAPPASSAAWAAVFDLLSPRHTWRPSGRDLVEALTAKIQGALDSREGLAADAAAAHAVVSPAEALLDSANRWDSAAAVQGLAFPAAGSHVASGLVFGLRDAWASLVADASRSQRHRGATAAARTAPSDSPCDGNARAASESPQRKPPRGPADPSSNTNRSPQRDAHNTSLALTTVSAVSQSTQRPGAAAELPVWIHAAVDGRSEMVTSVGWETLRARLGRSSGRSGGNYARRSSFVAAGTEPAPAASPAADSVLRRRHAAAAAAASLAETQRLQQEHQLQRAAAAAVAPNSHSSSNGSNLLLDPSILREERANGIVSTPAIDAQSIVRKGAVPPPAALPGGKNASASAAVSDVRDIEPAMACFVSLASLTAGAEPEQADIFVGESVSGAAAGRCAQSARELAERIVRDCNDVARPESLFCFAFDVFSGAVGEADRLLRGDVVLGGGGVALLASLAAAASVDHGFEWERGLFASMPHESGTVEIPRLQLLLRVPNEVNEDLDVARKRKQQQQQQLLRNGAMSGGDGARSSDVAAALRELSRALGGSPVRGRAFHSPPQRQDQLAASTSRIPRRTPARGAATPDPHLRVSARSGLVFSGSTRGVDVENVSYVEQAREAGATATPSKFQFLPAHHHILRTPPPAAAASKRRAI